MCHHVCHVRHQHLRVCAIVATVQHVYDASVVVLDVVVVTDVMVYVTVAP